MMTDTKEPQGTVRIHVSGKAYSAALSPDASAVPRESGWPTPRLVIHGKGHQARYEVSGEQAEDMAWHLDLIADNFIAFGEDDMTRAEGRACRKAAQVIRRVVGLRANTPECSARSGAVRYEG